MKFVVLFALCVAQFLIADSKIIPNRLPQPCPKSAPNYNECTYKVLKKMGPYISKGVRELNFPKMNPLEIPLFVVNRTLANLVNIDAVMRNFQIWGYDQAQIEHFEFDPKTLNGEFGFNVPFMRVSFEFEANGKILENNLVNAGYVKINSTNVRTLFKFSLKSIDKLGVKYYGFKDVKASGTIDDATFKLVAKNPEDQAIADGIMNFVNTNFKIGFDAVRPIYEESLEVFYKYLAEAVLNTVPAQELIPE